jgi:hypothetical protein
MLVYSLNIISAIVQWRDFMKVVNKTLLVCKTAALILRPFAEGGQRFYEVRLHYAG